eukprot:NODE_3521_length_952_cov_22.831515_g3369_i0.p1 GENE.NODE_3521_length_952_cov_22.831515_g3369_i0~~NODE_3521_length_952_cov_22.831515_g3369_i0.p1  ORF type:complete len:162 (+),score=31.05 NODE_3521_length_952_cov_22.831515_g3369_i0:399-884(+)
MRIKTPAKGNRCIHKSGFDLETFLIFCFAQKIWNCPICDSQCSFEMLRIDPLLSTILSTVTDLSVTHVVVHPDNTWQLPSTGQVVAVSKSKPPACTISLDSESDDDPTPNGGAPVAQALPAFKPPEERDETDTDQTPPPTYPSVTTFFDEPGAAIVIDESD